MQKYLIFLLAYFNILSGHTIAQPKLIGTNRLGGNGFGTIYKYTAGDSTLEDVLKINGSSILKVVSLVKIGQFFYGSDYSGGGAGLGSLFKYNINTKVITNLYQFDRDSGSTPNSRLLFASNGKLYGSTYQSGLYGGGTLFEFDPITETYTTILNCDSVSGTKIYSDFIQASNGNLYITTTHDGNNGYGTILELNLNTMTVQKIYDFIAIVGTFNSFAKGIDLIESFNGKLLGFSPVGGLNNCGLIFEFDLNTQAFSTKYNFDGINGKRPESVSKFNSTKIIGSTSEGGSNNHGVLFEYDLISDTYAKKIDFTGINGSKPSCKMIKLANGKMYGTTYSGGANNRGVIYEYNFSTNAFQKIYDFEIENYTYQIQLATDNIGNLYGSQNWQSQDTVFNYLFKYNIATGNMTKEVHFSLNDGYDLPGGFVLASNGKYYAATNKGGNNYNGVYNCGAIIEYDYNSNTILKKLDLNDSIGCESFSSLVHASNGKIYGTTTSGGAYNYGALFEYDYLTNTISNKYDFNVTNGVQLSSGGWLMEASNGKIYGTCEYGGLYGLGTLYEYDFVSNVFTTKINFNDTIGGDPHGGIVQASNGNLYLISNAGNFNFGGIIEYNIITESFYMKYNFTGNISGSSGSLIEVAPNKIYGIIGGQLCEYDCSSNQLNVLYNFLPANGYASGDLKYASNGKFYGVTYHNFATFGGLYEFDLATGIYSQKVNWHQIENGWKPGDRLLEVGCIAPGILASGPVSFCQGDSVILSAFGSNSNSFQWHRNGNPIAGANSQNFTVKLPGKYSVSVTDTTCSLLFTSNPVRVRIPCLPPFDNQDKLSSSLTYADVFLNYDSQQQLFEIIATDLTAETYNLLIADATGRILLNENSGISNNSIYRNIDCSTFAKGLYILKIVAGDKILSRKFVKER